MSSSNLQKLIGLPTPSEVYPSQHLVEYINLKLAAMGCPTADMASDLMSMMGHGPPHPSPDIGLLMINSLMTPVR